MNAPSLFLSVLLAACPTTSFHLSLYSSSTFSINRKVVCYLVRGKARLEDRWKRLWNPSSSMRRKMDQPRAPVLNGTARAWPLGPVVPERVPVDGPSAYKRNGTRGVTWTANQTSRTRSGRKVTWMAGERTLSVNVMAQPWPRLIALLHRVMNWYARLKEYKIVFASVRICCRCLIASSSFHQYR